MQGLSAWSYTYVSACWQYASHVSMHEKPPTPHEIGFLTFHQNQHFVFLHFQKCGTFLLFFRHHHCRNKVWLGVLVVSSQFIRLCASLDLQGLLWLAFGSTPELLRVWVVVVHTCISSTTAACSTAKCMHRLCMYFVDACPAYIHAKGCFM